MTETGWPNLVSMFFAQAERFGERPLLWRKRDGQYQPQTWREVAARVSALARGLRHLGVAKGDRVVLVCENRPAWLIADLAIMASGGITVPAYTTNTAADHRYILENSGARGVIVSGGKVAERLLAAVREVPAVRFVVGLEPLDEQLLPSGVTAIAWDDAVARGDGDHVNVVAEAAALVPDDPACIIYTSGTGGAPKGVLLPHRSILHNCAGAVEVLAELETGDDAFLSFLPLSHAYEHTVGQFVPIALGAEIYYAESVEKVAANLLEAHPTILSAVPRFFEMLQHRIVQGVHKAPGWRRKLFAMTLALGRKRLQAGGRLSLAERIADAALDRLVRGTVRARFGGRLKAMVSGGAPLNPEVAEFFLALGVPIYQGYGQTETGPLISVNRVGRIKLDAVGPPVSNTEIRIAEDGEILVRGPLVMLGYWRNEEATRETVRDGWLHTGDIGTIDADGFLRITDRKKDIIVNSGGDNISPARIENLLTQRPEIGQAMVYGDKRPHLVALIVPNGEWLRQWAKAAGKDGDAAALAADPDLHAALGKAIEAVNGSLAVVERLRRFAVAPEPFSLENGQMTPTLKIRRHVIRQAYGPVLEGLYR